MGFVPGGHPGCRIKKLSDCLLYLLEQRPTEKAIIEASVRERRPLPKAIQDAPELQLGLELFYIAFLDLTTCRHGLYQAEGEIPWTAIQEWADRKGVFGEQRDDLEYYISKMDEVYLRFKGKKLENSMKPPPGKKGGFKGKRK